MKKNWIAVCAAVVLTACGGGTDGPDSADVAARAQAQAKAPKASLSVSPSDLNLAVAAGTTAGADLALVYVSRNRRPVHLSVAPGNVVFDPPVFKNLGGGRYSARLSTAAGLAPGTYSGTMTLRMCKDSPCVRQIPDATATLTYRVAVASAIPDWQTFQGNARHTGYVPLTLDPTRFAKAWEWRRTTTGVLGFINAVATEAGKVFVTDDEYFGSLTSLYALNESDGTLAWRRDFVDAPALNPPAAADGVVYAATTGHSDTFLWAFRSSDGAPLFKSAFEGQWPHVLAPTIRGGRVFTNGGYYGGGVYAYDATTGAARWSGFAGDDDMSTPAVDENNVYHYSGTALEVYRAADGQPVASIADPYGPGFGYSYHAAPVLGSPDHVIAFSGGAFSGRASASTEHNDNRPLVNFSLRDAAPRWRTAATYLTQPAVAKGVVYAARNEPRSLDAISEATGEVLWSWTGTATDQEFHRNMVVTDNLLFVSTDTAVHALDLATRKPVWTYPAPGMLAISAQKMLYIVEGAREPTGRLIAIRLF